MPGPFGAKAPGTLQWLNLFTHLLNFWSKHLINSRPMVYPRRTVPYSPRTNGYKLNKNVAQAAIIRPRLRAFAPPRGAGKRGDISCSFLLRPTCACACLTAPPPPRCRRRRRQRRPVKGSSNRCIQHRQQLSGIQPSNFMQCCGHGFLFCLYLVAARHHQEIRFF